MPALVKRVRVHYWGDGSGRAQEKPCDFNRRSPWAGVLRARSQIGLAGFGDGQTCPHITPAGVSMAACGGVKAADQGLVDQLFEG